MFPPQSTIRSSRYLTHLSTFFRLKRAATFTALNLCSGCLLLLFLTAACGKIGEPLPPLIQIPRPVLDLTARQQGGEVILSWTLPRLNTDGSTATTLASIQIYRVIRAPASTTEAIPSAGDSDLWRVLKAQPASGREERQNVRDLLKEVDLTEVLGREFSYAIKVFNLKGQTAGFSNVANLWLQPVPHPPGRPNLNPSEKFVKVSWAPPATNIDGSPVVSGLTFNLYRTSAEGSFTETPLNPSPVSDVSYRDRSIRLGKTYAYRVRAVLETGRGWVESRDSEEAFLLHRDVYPPSTPQQLTLVVAREFLSLAWFPNSETDLAGYHVFRRQGRGDFQRLTSSVLQRPSYTDRDLQKGHIYSYRVAAIDRSGNQSGYSNVVSDTLE